MIDKLNASQITCVLEAYIDFDHARFTSVTFADVWRRYKTQQWRSDQNRYYAKQVQSCWTLRTKVYSIGFFSNICACWFILSIDFRITIEKELLQKESRSKEVNLITQLEELTKINDKQEHLICSHNEDLFKVSYFNVAHLSKN